jgi:TRAP-type C4-dicarboxylate transport system permease small subunit
VTAIDRVLRGLNRALVALCCIALLAAALILSESVAVRYFLQQTTDWQGEICVILLVGATFLSTAYVQEQRGHIGIDAVAQFLPAPAEWARLIFVDAASLAFCAFFAWKSWTLTLEAWDEDVVTDSTFASPLWLPYASMALGMTLLSVQIAAQLVARARKNPA